MHDLRLEMFGLRIITGGMYAEIDQAARGSFANAIASTHRPQGLRDDWSGPALPFCDETRRVNENLGFRWKLISWHWHDLVGDKCPGWEMIGDVTSWSAHPPFVRLEHVRGAEGTEVESAELRNAWDDIANGPFYQRDWTDDGIPWVNAGDRYWSGWWFATRAEAERFRAWHGAREIVAILEAG